jgi:cyclic pyranopterin phosphate synthase
MKKKKITHVDEKGDARMVDIGRKADSDRCAIASARIRVSKELFTRLEENTLSKGDALSVARIAGIQAAKKTSEIVPLCHPLPLTHVSVEIKLVGKPLSVVITAEVHTHYKTGVEMEALTAAAASALTIYDMGKSVDKGMIIESIQLEKKSGGQSGEWNRNKKNRWKS